MCEGIQSAWYVPTSELLPLLVITITNCLVGGCEQAEQGNPIHQGWHVAAPLETLWVLEVSQYHFN